MKISTPMSRWQRVDSITKHDGWTVRWYLNVSDHVRITGATTPGGREAALPDGELPLPTARNYIPGVVCDVVEAEKYKDCPRMQAFLRNHRQARESWLAYWEARGMS
jgi:hypothetical protein